MRNLWVKRLFRGALILVLTLVSVNLFCDKSVQASTYKDGTYSITVNSYQTGTKDTSKEPSKAGNFIGTGATATVHNDVANVTMNVSDTGSKLLGSTTVDRQAALSSDKHTLNFSIPVGTDSTVATFVIPMINMTQSCDFVFDWSGVNKNTDQAGLSTSQSTNADETDLNKNSTAAKTPQVKKVVKQDGITYYQLYVTNPDATIKNIGEVPAPKDIKLGTNLAIEPINDGNGNVIGYNAAYTNNQGNKILLGTIDKDSSSFKPAPAVQAPATSTNAKSNQGSAVSPLTNVSKLTYSVLQSNDKSISEANKYYTHVADIEKLNDGSYKVTMHVQYGKNSGMSAKGFVPLTVDGQKVSDVTYGSTDKDYTASFSFTVKSLDELVKAPVKGTIHVSVPMMGISSDFDVYYKFGAPAQGSNHSSSRNGSKAAEAPGKAGRSAAKANAAKKATGELPQTSELQTITAAAIGLVSLVLISTIVIYRRKRA
ncbi:cell surface protein [Secundilactobacillus pentosiphilus]|uniref:Cell surface protein n=1 Tax=Secundilactobacillus pentosiphilus TaxID=1714682 RepID=A0A1Z5ILJ1_9LACO|nr:LPXTG cell wall anchor domain-containing protein [Secundilactobacillus pentosiphilus]GAX02627.1 cell surface protein [Secundilactobacillus pentosiphilus]